MIRATPRAKRLAEHLLGLERVAGKRAAGPAAARAFQKFRHHLSVSMGAASVRELLARALVLTREEVPGMRAVQINADGSLENLGKVLTQSDNGKIAKEEVILVAHLLGLLVVMVGEALMLSLVQDAWPKVTLDHLGSGSDEGDSL